MGQRIEGAIIVRKGTKGGEVLGHPCVGNSWLNVTTDYIIVEKRGNNGAGSMGRGAINKRG